VVGTPAHNGQYENSKQASAARGRTVVQKKDRSESGTRDPTHFGELVVAAVVLVLVLLLLLLLVVVVVVVVVVVAVTITWATYRDSTKPNRKLPHSVHAYLPRKVKVKVKQSRYRPRGFQEVKVPRLHDNGTGWWEGCQPHAPIAFTPRKCSWYSFLLEAESTPGP
jgi:hypothetical protein